MRNAALAVLLASSTLLAQRNVTSPSGYGRILFPGGGPATFNGGGNGAVAQGPVPSPYGRTLFPGGTGPGGPVPAVLRGPRNNFATVLPGTPFPPVGHPNHGTGVVAYPIFVNGGGYYQYDPPQAQFVNNYVPSGPDSGQQDSPVVIVNQYFRDDRPVSDPQSAVAPAPAASVNAAPVKNTPEAPIFLIAMKDHTIYAASAYWVEDNTLNYVTIQGNENRVSMDLIDRDLSRRLNRDRSVSFGLPLQ
ncbi:MAG: hypothetical protein WDO18_20185 [Acidobacteriota bacterium]